MSTNIPSQNTLFSPKIRHESLDAIRGFAVLGILIVNIYAVAWLPITYDLPYYYPFAETTLSLIVHWIRDTFFNTKCIALFSMLFGASLVMIGGEVKDRSANLRLIRRLFWLAAFGLVHGMLIWSGDILLTYAVLGLLAMWLRPLGAKTLLILGAFIHLGVSGLDLSHSYDITQLPAAEQAEIAKEMNASTPESRLAEANALSGTLMSVTRQNFEDWIPIYSDPIDAIYDLQLLGFMLIGMGLFKSGFMIGESRNKTYVIVVLAAGLSLAMIGWQSAQMIQQGFPLPQAYTIGIAANMLLGPLVSFGYMAGIILLLRKGLHLSPLQAVGRMAFTNYLTQSLIMTTVFWGGRGLGLINQWDRPTVTLFVIAVWGLQLIWSPLWLAQFRMGPFEWIWRCLTEGRWLPLRKAAT